jgi:hypothetical protein
MASSLAAVRAVAPSADSARPTVFTPKEASLAKSAALHFKSARAARIWALETRRLCTWGMASYGVIPLACSANSNSRRIASERVSLPLSRLVHNSMAFFKAAGRRMAEMGACPVAGRPRFLRKTFIDNPQYSFYKKS